MEGNSETLLGQLLRNLADVFSSLFYRYVMLDLWKYWFSAGCNARMFKNRKHFWNFEILNIPHSATRWKMKIFTIPACRFCRTTRDEHIFRFSDFRLFMWIFYTFWPIFPYISQISAHTSQLRRVISRQPLRVEGQLSPIWKLDNQRYQWRF